MIDVGEPAKDKHALELCMREARPLAPIALHHRSLPWGEELPSVTPMGGGIGNISCPRQQTPSSLLTRWWPISHHSHKRRSGNEIVKRRGSVVAGASVGVITAVLAMSPAFAAIDRQYHYCAAGKKMALTSVTTGKPIHDYSTGQRFTWAGSLNWQTRSSNASANENWSAVNTDGSIASVSRRCI